MPSRTISSSAAEKAAPRTGVPPASSFLRPPPSSILYPSSLSSAFPPLSAFRLPPSAFRFSPAFSLIELLLVIAIIGILSSLAVVGFNSIGRGAGARGAADIAASMALSARIEAMSFGYGSLLVVDNSANTDKKLQRMAVLRYTNAPDAANVGKNAEIVGKPTALPKGTFFLPDYSMGYQAANLTNFAGGVSTPVYYFRFDGSGHYLETAGVTNRLVFSGNIMDTSGNLQNPTNMVQGCRGFILRKNGRPAFYQNAITP